MDYAKFAVLADKQIRDKGRAISLFKLSGVPADNAKPWRGAGTQTKTGQIDTFGLFVIPNTSIPTESRGLGLDWIDQDLLKRTRRVCLVPALGLADLEPYSLLSDGGREYVLIWGQCFKPGDTRIFYVFGLAE